MKQLLIVLILFISFRSAAQRDSTHLKRTELWEQLKTAFSKDWELRSIDQSEKTNWDTIYSLPTALFRVELVWKKLPDFATLYFFEKEEKDTSHIKIIQQVLDKYITTQFNRMFSAFPDTLDKGEALLPPVLYENQNLFMLGFYLETKSSADFSKNLGQLNPPLIDMDISLTDIKQEEKVIEPPPPPPPRPKKNK